MYLDPKLFALQVAVLDVMLKHNTDLKGEIEKAAQFYEETFFLPNEEARSSMREALEYMEARRHEDQNIAKDAQRTTAIVSLQPIAQEPPRDDEEYLVMMSSRGVQEKVFTVALWQDKQWWPDAGDADTITHWADLAVFDGF
jgi:hypothetical protein